MMGQKHRHPTPSPTEDQDGSALGTSLDLIQMPLQARLGLLYKVALEFALCHTALFS